MSDPLKDDNPREQKTSPLLQIAIWIAILLVCFLFEWHHHRG